MRRWQLGFLAGYFVSFAAIMLIANQHLPFMVRSYGPAVTLLSLFIASFMMDIGAWIGRIFLTIIQLFIRVITALYEAIPVIE